MTSKKEKVLAGWLWGAYGVLALAGLALLAEALFVPRLPRRLAGSLPIASEAPDPLSFPTMDGLARHRFTRRIASAAPLPAETRPRDTTLDQMIKLTGILDFGGKQPTLAVIEAAGESKAFKVGDKVGETGVLIKDIKDYMIVEFDKRRFKVTFVGIQELPANSVGKD